MAYADKVDNENIESNYLIVLSPRRKVSSWILDSGSTYTASYTLGHVSGASVDGVALTEASSSALTSGQFFFDFETETVYVRLSDDSDPNNAFVVLTYELYIGTFDASVGRIPTDQNSRAVYFEPLVTKSPSLKQSAKDVLYGYLPVQTFSFSASNQTHFFNEHISDSSFNQAEIKVYHWLDTPLVYTNIKKVLSGLIGGINYTDKQVSITGFDRVDILDREFRTDASVAGSFYSTTDFPNVNPASIGKPISYIYGRVGGFMPVNVDFVSENPTTSDNRDWVVCGEVSGIAALTRTVPASPSSTTTRTYLDDATGYVVGDGVWIDKVTDEYRIITNVDYDNNYIEHSALSSGAATSGHTVKRGFVSRIDIEHEGVVYTAYYNRDYTINLDYNSKGVSGFSFKTSLESNLGMPSNLSSYSRVSAIVYGKQNDVTLGGSAFGSDSTKTDSLTDPAVILFDLLKSRAGLAESELGITSFQTFQGLSNGEVGFSIPKDSFGTFPKIKDIVVDLLKSTISNTYIDDDGLLSVTKLGVLPVSPDKTIDDTEILDESFKYTFDYKDVVSDVLVTYNRRASDLKVDPNGGEVFDTSSAQNNTAKYLHSKDSTMTHDSLLLFLSDAATLAQQIADIMGERRGLISFDAKNRFLDLEVNQSIDVSRTRMPSFAFDKLTERTKSMRVVSVTKGLDKVVIECDDQKGIEDNSGDF